MSVDRNQKFEIGALFFSDGFEAQIDVLLCEAGHLFLLSFELFVDLLNILVELWVRLDFLQLMIDLLELNLKAPLLALDVASIGLSGPSGQTGVMLLPTPGKFEHREVPEICAAFD